LPKQKAGAEATRGDRPFIEPVLYRAKTGMPWRDLPELRPWKSVYNRFANWVRKGHWATIFEELQVEVDETGSIVDGSVVRAHQDASREKGGVQSNALDGSRGGFSTKLHAVVDTKGRPIHIVLTAGQRHEMTMADALLEHAHGKALIADSGYDSNRFRAITTRFEKTARKRSGGAPSSAFLSRCALLEEFTGRREVRKEIYSSPSHT
jgi:transposase